MTPPVHEPCENKGSRPAKKDVQQRKNTVRMQVSRNIGCRQGFDSGDSRDEAERAYGCACIYMAKQGGVYADERWVPFEVRTTTSPQDIIQVEGKEMGSRVKYSARTESKRV